MIGYRMAWALNQQCNREKNIISNLTESSDNFQQIKAKVCNKSVRIFKLQLYNISVKVTHSNIYNRANVKSIENVTLEMTKSN